MPGRGLGPAPALGKAGWQSKVNVPFLQNRDLPFRERCVPDSAGRGVDISTGFAYHVCRMKKTWARLFPLLFALLTLALFLLLYRPSLESPLMTSAVLVFLTALGWSSLIVFSRQEMRERKFAYPISALLISILWVLALRPFPVDPLQHYLMVIFQGLGMAGIALYVHILKRKGENPHD
jgi:hypothetical protein